MRYLLTHSVQLVLHVESFSVHQSPPAPPQVVTTLRPACSLAYALAFVIPYAKVALRYS